MAKFLRESQIDMKEGPIYTIPASIVGLRHGMISVG